MFAPFLASDALNSFEITFEGCLTPHCQKIGQRHPPVTVQPTTLTRVLGARACRTEERTSHEEVPDHWWTRVHGVGADPKALPFWIRGGRSRQWSGRRSGTGFARGRLHRRGCPRNQLLGEGP